MLEMLCLTNMDENKQFHLEWLLLHVDLQPMLAHVVEGVGKDGGHLRLRLLLLVLVQRVLSIV